MSLRSVSRRLFNRAVPKIVRFGHGSRERVWIKGIIVLLLLWLVFGSLTIARSPAVSALRDDCRMSPKETIEAITCWVTVVDETAYRLFLTLGGSDNYLRHAAGPDDSPSSLSCQLSLVRFLGVALPLWIALPPLVAWIFRRGESWAARNYLSHHYIIVGFGQAGSALAIDLLRRKDRALVIVESGVISPELAAARRDGAILIERDARSSIADDDGRGLIRDLAAHRADGIFVATGDTSRNIDLAGRLARGIAAVRDKGSRRASRWPAARIVPHIDSRRLMLWITSEAGKAWLTGRDRGSGAAATRRPAIFPFSANQTAVRQLLTERPLASYAALRNASRPHLVILGHDSVAEWLIPQAVQAALAPKLDPPKITWIIDGRPSHGASEAASGTEAIAPDVKEYRGALQENLDAAIAPDVEEYREALKKNLDIDIQIASYDFRYLDEELLNLAEPLPKALENLGRLLDGLEAPARPPEILEDARLATTHYDPVTSIFICFGDDDHNLDIALRLQDLISRKRRWLAPTFARLYRDSGLEDVLSRCEKQNQPSLVIDDFGQDDRTCTKEEVFYPPRDRAAREAHRVYEINASLDALAAALDPQTAGAQLADALETLNSPPHDSAVRQDVDRLRERAKRKSAASAVSLIGEWLAGAPGHPGRRGWIKRAWPTPAGDLLQRRMAAMHCVRSALAGEEARFQPATADLGASWQQLDYEYIVSNRDVVDHIAVRLRSLGYRPLRGGSGDERVESTVLRGPWIVGDAWQAHARAFLQRFEGSSTGKLPDALERLAAAEHDRYLVERLIAGWRFGHLRDNQRRLRPSLVPYEHLPEYERQKDRQSVIDLKAVLPELHPAREWRPECRIGLYCDGALASTHLAALDGSIDTILDAVILLEYAARARRVGMDSAAGAPGHTPLATLAMAKAHSALCLIASMDQRRPDELAPAGGAEMGLQQALRACATRAGLPARVIAARLTPLTERAARACGAESGVHEDDFWEIDMLPEGLARAGLDPEGAIVWMPGASPADPGAPASDDFRDEMTKVRRQAWETVFRPRLHCYLAQQADWLMVVGHRDAPQIPGEFERDAEPGYDGLRPPADHWTQTSTGCYRLNAGSGTAQRCDVSIDPAQRLVRVLIADAAEEAC